MKTLPAISLFILVFLNLTVLAQKPSRSKWVATADTIKLDSLSLVYQSVMVFDAKQQNITSQSFEIDHSKSLLILKTKGLTDSLHVYYKVLPYDFSANYPRSNTKWQVQKAKNKLYDGNSASFYGPDTTSAFNLQTNGLISRGMVVGNNQNLVTVSNLNMQVTGQLSHDLFIEAMLSDKNIPLQPDGYTQQIQDFDQVFIKIYDSLKYVKMGDVQLNHTDGFFMRFSRKIQGAEMGYRSQQYKKTQSYAKASGAVAKGTYHRLNFSGIEGVMGPYRLTGAHNEQYIVVLAGSEKVYIDGTLLQRGEQADYVMNYNTAEITFMPSIMITQNSRITVEYEYSDRNYNRYLLYANSGISKDNSSLKTSFFSETDAKSQPVDQPLSDAEELVLTNAGNNPLNAIVPNFDSALFDKNVVMYRLTDTLVNGMLYDSIFVHSIDPKLAHYQVGFAFVGENKGHYQPQEGATNGRSYKWIAPLNQVLQGSYEPIKLLVAPKKHQMFVVEASHKAKNTATGIEWAVTQTDSNTFSHFDNSQNLGMAVKANVLQTLKSGTTAMNIGASYQFLSEQFNAFDRFREVEFNRNWNLPVTVAGPQHLAQAQFSLKHHTVKQFNITTAMLVNPGQYEGFKHDLSLNSNLFKTNLNGAISYLKSSASNLKTGFYRHKVSWHIPNRYFNTTWRNELEHNQQVSSKTDSMVNSSKKFVLNELLVSAPDTLHKTLNVSTLYRTDYVPYQNQFERYSTSWQNGLNAGFTTQNGQVFRGVLTYSQLNYKAPLPEKSGANEQNFLARADYRVGLLKKSTTLNCFYEVGTGLETRREFAYIEVPAGQGLYIWNDYNANGVPELNEFEVSSIPEEANYIRIMTPTAEYMKVYTAQMNATLVTNLSRIWPNAVGAKKFWAKWQNNFSYRSLQKHTNADWKARLNPFVPQGIDTNHITSNSSLRNTLSFNRINPKFGADWIFTQQQQKTLLSYGFDQNQNHQNQLNCRWNVNAWFLITNIADEGLKAYHSEYFASKNYSIQHLGNRIDFQFQPGITFRTNVFYAYKGKTNVIGAKETAKIQEAGAEFKLSAPLKGSLGLRFSAIYAGLNGINGTPVAYELLEGNQPGLNYRWNLNVARNLNRFLKLTVYYTGRKMPGVAIIHTGQLNLSAYF